MKAFVITDMEGVAGIVKWKQTTGGEKLYDEARVLYTEEINAAVDAALFAGMHAMAGAPDGVLASRSTSPRRHGSASSRTARASRCAARARSSPAPRDWWTAWSQFYF